MREWLQRNGVDPSSVQFLEIPFPQMADALFQNRLDAVWNVEPFLTFMVRSGNARVIAYPYQENVPTHGHHRLCGEGELGEGQPRRGAPLQARHRPARRRT